jgi:lysyl-tRNA synthetase class 1
VKIKWPAQEAEKILKRHGKPDRTVVFETGYGPSGLPHIGTFAEVARTCFVKEALEHLAPAMATRLIVFSDDMDGLRSVPQNLPRPDLLAAHLGKPLSSIPDPFAEEKSFSAYMNKQLCRFLDSFGFAYEFMSSTDCYNAGMFDEGLEKVLAAYDEIKGVFTATIREDKRERWSPFFVICEGCGKVNSTSVTDVDADRRRIQYQCDQAVGGVPACGHRGETPVTGGRAKVGWKIDWALRWYMLGVDYEMHGKDLIDSVSVSSKICRILGKPPPLTYKYELFHDETGLKISKKLGNGITMDQWIDYAPLGALIHFLLGNPNKPTKMGLPILPKLVDDLLNTVRVECGQERAPDMAIWFLERFPVERSRLMPEHTTVVGYSLLANVAENLGLQDVELLYGYARQYDESVEEDAPFYRGMCGNVLRYVEEYAKGLPKPELSVRTDWAPWLDVIEKHIAEGFGDDDHIDGDAMQSFLFSIARENELEMRDWFAFLYGVILEKTQGPKLGRFFQAVGQKKALELVRAGRDRLR